MTTHTHTLTPAGQGQEPTGLLYIQAGLVGMEAHTHTPPPSRLGHEPTHLLYTQAGLVGMGAKPHPHQQPIWPWAWDPI